MIGGYDWRIRAVVYAALALPAVAGILARGFAPRAWSRPRALSCSLIFFAATNFAVWAFSGMYSPDMAGLTQCYVAGLPFLKYTVAGDLFWAAVLFGGASLVQRLTARRRAAPTRICAPQPASRRRIRRALIPTLSSIVRGTGSGSASCRPTVTTRSSVTVCATSFTGPSGIASLTRGGCLRKYAAK